jgi:hypothetical protein
MGKQDSQARSKAIKEHCLWCTGSQVGEISKCLLFGLLIKCLSERVKDDLKPSKFFSWFQKKAGMMVLEGM